MLCAEPDPSADRGECSPPWRNAERKRRWKGHRERQAGGKINPDRCDRQWTGNRLPDHPEPVRRREGGAHRDRHDECPAASDRDLRKRTWAADRLQ